MRPLADRLRYYNNLGVAPGLEALKKLRDFYPEKRFNILKDPEASQVWACISCSVEWWRGAWSCTAQAKKRMICWNERGCGRGAEHGVYVVPWSLCHQHTGPPDRKLLALQKPMLWPLCPLSVDHAWRNALLGVKACPLHQVEQGLCRGADGWKA